MTDSQMFRICLADVSHMFHVKHMRTLKPFKSILSIESAYVAYVLANYTRAHDHKKSQPHVRESAHMLMLSHAYTRTRRERKHLRHMRGARQSLIRQALRLAYVQLLTYASLSAKHMRGSLKGESVRFKTFEPRSSVSYLFRDSRCQTQRQLCS